ncbi:hypothetical protein P6144_18115 [Sphingomonas sp. HITSZ_GF]|uniref:hypothetical protein n=1 Tax=Sphingomonas sp. HITSZ_GF TaxID=3037247 RepID=UPI00240D871B|nr:hypothetical protein [Sphingomonas sp. HITSZ_GF]MDG2535582.1 hypothetical protein [Sphingomonas sp. HITSZ_GF]
MILTAALLLFAQDVPATQAVGAPVEDEAQIVVRATFGRTTMLFDKGADGKLHNCRVMISSGSQRRDTTACQATPICYAKTADEVTDCTEMTVFDQAATIGGPSPAAPGVAKPNLFELPKLVQPKPVFSASAMGPVDRSEERREAEQQQRVTKITPPANPASDGPVVRFTTGNTQQQHDDTDKSEKRP